MGVWLFCIAVPELDPAKQLAPHVTHEYHKQTTRLKKQWLHGHLGPFVAFCQLGVVVTGDLEA